MGKKARRDAILIFLSLIFFIVLNMIIFPLVKKEESVVLPFVTIFIFWAFMIITLFFISTRYKNY